MPQTGPHFYFAEILNASEKCTRVVQGCDDRLDAYLVTGEAVAIHLFEQCPTPLQISTILNANTAADHYSLLALPGELFATEGTPGLDKALAMLQIVYPRKAMAYQVIDEALVMVSVYYHWPDAADGEGAWRFGPPSDLTDFQCHTVELNRIRWKVAALGTQQFWDPAAQERERQRQQQGNRHTNRTRRPRRQHQRAAQVYYDILGVRREASEVEVKQAYRALAQAFHPDRNTSPQASEHMKRINEAYRQIMKK